jgi:hypothetical protein
VVDVIEARLLAPVFEDVNGVKIAQRVDELPVSVQNLMIDVGSGNTDVVAIVPTTAAQPVSLPGITQSQATISITVPSRWLIIAAGTLFFMIGLALFTFSLGSYVKLRRQYSH